MERVQIYRVNHIRCIQIGEESILYGGFAQIYEEFCPKVLFFSLFLVGMTVNYGIKERKELQAFSE
jgi:hypothetical protein